MRAGLGWAGCLGQPRPAPTRPRPQEAPRLTAPSPLPPLPDNFALLSRVRNKPYDVFGCWLTETSLISGNLHRIGDITSCSVLWLNNAFQVRARVPPAAVASSACCPPAVSHPQDVESENVNVVKRLFKIQNLNASTIRTVMVADCSRFDSPDLLLDDGATPGRVFDLGGDSEDEAVGPGPAPARTKEGLRRFLDGLLDGRAQPQLSEHALETQVAELLAQGRTKPPEHSTAAARKLLVFTTGCLTYSPHQIGSGGRPSPVAGAGAGGGTARLPCRLGGRGEARVPWPRRERDWGAQPRFSLPDGVFRGGL